MGTNLDPYAGLVVRLTNVPIVRDGSLGPGLVNGDKNDVAPRLGLSYALSDDTQRRVVSIHLWYRSIHTLTNSKSDKS